jgi:sulfatase modifying factor 1
MLCIGAATFFSACSPGVSHKRGKGAGISMVTGWPQNDGRYGGFDVTEYRGQPTPIGMVFVQGGRFTMGAVDDEMPTLENNSLRRTVSVSSFYMDETECENVSYREYVYWLRRAYSNDYPELVAAAWPDETVWRSALAYNEPFVKNYFEAAAYNHYPVVGVDWYQANEFCKWRTDRVNEYALIQHGALAPNVNQSGEDVFTTETYRYGMYEGTTGPRKKKDLDPNGAGTRNMTLSDGVFFPDYRLPTEAEWEYAALGLIGNNPTPENKRRRGEEVFTDRNSLPWGPKNTTRYGLHNQYQGEIEGNFMRGKGDVMGVAGGLNDNADVTAPVRSYLRNAFGLYNMAGNVNEWVMDTYRPTSAEDVAEFRPFRGNQYTYKVRQEDGTLEEKDSIGHLVYNNMSDAQVQSNGRYETRTGNLSSYRDGDTLSQFTYAYGVNSLINDSTKVYKGGSFKDRAYWLSPGTRRYRQGNLPSADIGFRCVMDRMGSPTGEAVPAGNHFGQIKKHKR